MISSIDSLTPADWQLLDQVGAAASHYSGRRAIKVRPLSGWPFAWLLHPGLTDGLTVADITSLRHLEEAGLVVIDQKSGSQRAGQEMRLTPQGEATYKRLVYSGGNDGRSTRNRHG